MHIQPCFIGMLIAVVATNLNAQQNLIRNGSFEAHGEQKCLTCNTLYGQYPALVYHWDNGGWGCWLLDKDYKRSSDDNKGLNGNPFDNISPQHGKAMIEMAFFPSSGGRINEGTSYLTARTTQPMRVGNLYEVSFWLHIRSSKRPDPHWAEHIGIALLPQNIKVHGLGPYNKGLVLPFLSIDTVIYDTWYQVKWRVRPLCTSNYLMIGVFQDAEWEKRSGGDSFYYIDNVTVFEIPTTSAVADSSVYYCSRYDPKTLGIPPQMDTETLLFQNKEFELTVAQRTALDSFAGFAQKYPDLVFEISGHTDSIGTGNLELSQKRAQSVLAYLTGTHNIPEFRFIAQGKGSQHPYRPNQTEEGRTLNRRAEIKQSNLEIPTMFYRNALRACAEKNHAEAFSYLSKWLIKYKYGTNIIVLFDPRFDALHKDKRWLLIKKKVQDGYKGLKHGGHAFFLDSLRLDAARASGELTVNGYKSGFNALSGYVFGVDNEPFEMEPLPESEIEKKRSNNMKALRPILQKAGWPTKATFGESAPHSAFAILLHSQDVVEYLKWLPALQKACEEGEAQWMYYAKLYDQCNLALGLPQRYVTSVYHLENGEIEVPQWEGTVDSVNEHRAKIGLQLLSNDVRESMENQK